LKFSGSATLQENVPLAPLTTLGVGGPARFLIRITEEKQVPEALEFAGAGQWPVFVLGGGSNVLVSDHGFPGLVLQMALRGIQAGNIGNGEVVAAAGEDWDPFVAWCLARNLAGLECLSGIPGTAGGTPVQNVGAYGQEVRDTIRTVRVFDRNSSGFVDLSKEECGFSYRSSIFNRQSRDRYIVLSVTFALSTGGSPRIQYADLEHLFADRAMSPSLLDVREAVLKIRAAKGMVLTPGDPDRRSAGSFFKNPILKEQGAQVIEDNARACGRLGRSESLPRYPVGNGMVKLPAAWLIERAGFSKGYGRGRAGLSGKHTLAIINRGGASANDIIDLMKEIQAGVRTAFGIDLLPEPVLVGF
jgi:UDP-N-acetylmuramate dehydrogenase